MNINQQSDLLIINNSCNNSCNKNINNNNNNNLILASLNYRHSENLNSSELLFWRCFRCKNIFNKIFSNFNNIDIIRSGKRINNHQIYKYFIPYNQHSNASDIIKGFKNGPNIIRDKVKCRDFITLSKSCQLAIYNNREFRKFNKENKVFYWQLFNNYIDHFNQIKYSLPIIIESNNITALNQFVQFFYSHVKDIKLYFNNYFNIEFPKLHPSRIRIISYQQLKRINFYKSSNLLYSDNDFIMIDIQFSNILNSSSLKLKHLFKIISTLQFYNFNFFYVVSLNDINLNYIYQVVSNKLISKDHLNLKPDFVYSFSYTDGFENILGKIESESSLNSGDVSNEIGTDYSRDSNLVNKEDVISNNSLEKKEILHCNDSKSNDSTVLVINNKDSTISEVYDSLFGNEIIVINDENSTPNSQDYINNILINDSSSDINSILIKDSSNQVLNNSESISKEIIVISDENSTLNSPDDNDNIENIEQRYTKEQMIENENYNGFNSYTLINEENSTNISLYSYECENIKSFGSNNYNNIISYREIPIKKDIILNYILKCFQVLKFASSNQEDCENINKSIERYKEMYYYRNYFIELENQIENENCDSLYSIIILIRENYYNLNNKNVQFRLFKWLRLHRNESSGFLNSIKLLENNFDKDLMVNLFESNIEDFLLEITSELELFYYYQHYYSVFFKNGNQNWRFIKSLAILRNYQQLMTIGGKFFIIDNYDSNHGILNSLYIESPLERIVYSDPYIYYFSNSFQIESYYDLILKYFNSNSSSDRKLALLLFKRYIQLSFSNGNNFDFRNISNLNLSNNQLHCNRFLLLLFNNMTGIREFPKENRYIVYASNGSGLENINFIFNGFQICQILYNYNKYHEILYFFDSSCSDIGGKLFNLNMLNNLKELFKINNNFNFEFINLLIKKSLIENNNNNNGSFISNQYKELIEYCFTCISVKGIFQLFKLLISKYSSILKVKFKLTDGIFKKSTLKDLLIILINCDHFKIVELLYKHSNFRLTKSEFSIINQNSLSYNYFKNKI